MPTDQRNVKRLIIRGDGSFNVDPNGDWVSSHDFDEALAEIELLRERVKGEQAANRNLTHSFKNFHRLLCQRFGYGHDPIDWHRDQLSLIEFIAGRNDDH